MSNNRPMCERCRRYVDCGTDKYCYCGLTPPQTHKQEKNPGYERLIVCNGCTDLAIREGTDFVCRARTPHPEQTKQPFPDHQVRTPYAFQNNPAGPMTA